MPPDSIVREQAWFVIPAYNEAAVIQSVVAQVRSCYPNVVVVDDGSSDDTAREATRAGAIVVTHPINLGQGAALQTGMDFALRQQAGYIVTFDADGQHCLEDVDSMLHVLQAENCDVVLGSRFCGSAENLPRLRWLVLKVAIRFTRLTTGLNLTDTHNGIRVLRASAATKIRLRQNGMAHASELLNQVAALKLRYIEVPVTTHYTAYSVHKGQKLSNSISILMDLLIARFTK